MSNTVHLHRTDEQNPVISRVFYYPAVKFYYRAANKDLTSEAVPEYYCIPMLKPFKILSVSVFLILSTAAIPAQETENTEEGSEHRRAMLGARVTFAPVTFKSESTLPLSKGSTSWSLGAFITYAPVNWLNIESGIHYRWLSMGGIFSNDLFIRELRLPAVVKFVIPAASNRFFIGGGIFYFNELSAKYSRTLADQAPIAIPGDDLTEGIGYTITVGSQAYYISERVITTTALSYHHSEKMFNITMREFSFSMGFGFAI